MAPADVHATRGYRGAPDLLDVAGSRLVARLPTAAEIASATLLVLADIPGPVAAPLIAAAQAAGVAVEHHARATKAAPDATAEAVDAWTGPCLIYAF